MPHVFHEIFYDNSVQNPQGLWPTSGVTRTVNSNFGYIVPFSTDLGSNAGQSISLNGGYWANNAIDVIRVLEILLIQYDFSTPIDLSDIIGFEFLYDSQTGLLHGTAIDITDSSSRTLRYTQQPSPSGVQLLATNNNFTADDASTINPRNSMMTASRMIVGTTIDTTKIVKIEVKILIGTDFFGFGKRLIMPQNTFVIYAISSVYNTSIYQSLFNGFRDTFMLTQNPIVIFSSSNPFPSQQNSISNDGSIVPPVSSRVLNRPTSFDTISVNLFRYDFNIIAGSNNFYPISKGLIVTKFPYQTSNSTFVVEYIFSTPYTNTGNTFSRTFNVLIPYYSFIAITSIPNPNTLLANIRVALAFFGVNFTGEITLLDEYIIFSPSTELFSYFYRTITISIPANSTFDKLRIYITVPGSRLFYFVHFQFLAISPGTINPGAVCVLEDTRILLSNGQWKKVQDLIRGDSIACKDGSSLPLCRLIIRDISECDVDFIFIPKDAIARGLPMNDLYCCKHHYFLYNDKLYSAGSFLSFPGVKRIQGLGKEVLPKHRMYDLQFETEGFYIAEGLLCPSRSPYDADDPLPRELFFDQSLFRPNIPKSQLDHLLGFPMSFDRISLKAKWNWKKFLQMLKEQGIKVSQETYEEALKLRKSLGHKVKVIELEYEE
jgi:hypothetical protein